MMVNQLEAPFSAAKSLNIHKAADPDSLHPLILKPLPENETLLTPLQFSFMLSQVHAAAPTHESTQ